MKGVEATAMAMAVVGLVAAVMDLGSADRAVEAVTDLG